MNINNYITLDVECYKNYFLAMFSRVFDGKKIYFESFNDSPLDLASLRNILKKYTIVTFNGHKYDKIMCEVALQGFKNLDLYKISKTIIEENLQPWKVRKRFAVREVKMGHIDLIEVCPLAASLKIYAGRLHCKNLQDLPLNPDEPMTEEMREPMRTYCGYDNDNTALLLRKLEKQIDLRAAMSKEYNDDFRSKSDAQMAELVIKKALGRTIKRPKIETGTVFKYSGPEYLDYFQTDQLKEIVNLYRNSPIVVGKSGHCELIFNRDEVGQLNEKGKEIKPKKQIKIRIGQTDYAVGIGGIHSKEKNISFRSCDKYQIRDYDVAAFYPNIILNNEYYPQHIGREFLKIYGDIVARRIKAKKAGDRVTNESLKITINGSFGKLGSKWSILYAPDLMANVTITGQLSLLLLIERFELAGISVLSANTDGIVVKLPRDREEDAADIITEWELDTNYEMESTNYVSLNCRDVNAYIAIKEGEPDTEGEYADWKYHIKGKGLYADQRDGYYCLRSNPACDIATEAVKIFLKCGTPIEETIRGCRDITRFLTLRTVNGGAVKDGELLGKAIRWYYGSHELEPIRYSTTGNKVPKSDGAVPLMTLDGSFPNDVDFDRYIDEAYTILKDIGRKVA